ncbi:unnamed protein product, partial [Protopolystoma xenopodis]
HHRSLEHASSTSYSSDSRSSKDRVSSNESFGSDPGTEYPRGSHDPIIANVKSGSTVAGSAPTSAPRIHNRHFAAARWPACLMSRPDETESLRPAEDPDEACFERRRVKSIMQARTELMPINMRPKDLTVGSITVIRIAYRLFAL